MLTRLGCNNAAPAARRRTPALLALLLLLLAAAPLRAQTPPLPPVTVGAGVQTSFVHTMPGRRDVDRRLRAEQRPSLRERLGHRRRSSSCSTPSTTAPATHVDVLDAVGAVRDRRTSSTSGSAASCRRATAPTCTARTTRTTGRSTPTASRTAIRSSPPAATTASLYWGQFDKVKVSGGVVRRRVGDRQQRRCSAPAASQVDFWDPEAGYYLNGTYYGDKNLLAVGVAGQVQGSDKSAWNADFLLEKKVPGGGAFTVESRVREVRPARRLQRALRRRATAATCWRAICFRRRWA